MAKKDYFSQLGNQSSERTGGSRESTHINEQRTGNNQSSGDFGPDKQFE